MVEWAASGDRICGFGARGTVELDTEGWRPCGDAPTLPGSVDAAVSGTADAVRLPVGDAVRVDADGRALREGELSDRVHRVVVGTTPETRLAFEGPATVGEDSRPWISFAESASALAVGFTETPPPRSVVGVPATPAGLATGVTAAGRTHDTTGPERSHPGFRPRTPWVRFGDRSVPDELDGSTDGPTLTVPESVTGVLVAAPLAYYLGAELRVESGPPTVDGDGLCHEFDPLPAFADEAASALRGLCHLDGRLRSIPGESGPLVDAPDLASAPPARRLAHVLDSPPETLPDWPLTTYVSGEVLNGRYLPYLLDRLSLVHPADASVLDPRALLKRSLDEFFRGETPNVEAVDPSLTDSRHHAWLGDGTPVDAYSLVRPESVSPVADDGVRIDVVCNDPGMTSERSVADVYRRRLSGRAVAIRVHEGLTTGELEAVFQRPTDLVHFIGHCEVDGMVCSDGALAAADLDTCAAAAFFLNACGSYYEGYDLVASGASVGAVTLTPVLDEQAACLGTTFAELLAAGYAFDRALSLARGEIIVGRDYVVIGDGTLRLRHPTGVPGTLSLGETDRGFTVRYDATPPDAAGRRTRCPVDGRERLCGDMVETTMDRRSVVELLDCGSMPVLYHGDLHWSDDLAADLSRPERRRQ